MPSGSLGVLTPLLIRKQKQMDALCCMTEWESDDALESGTPVHNEVGLPQQSTKRNKTFKDSVNSRPLILSQAAIVNLTLDKDRREKSALDQLVFDRHKTIDAPIFKDATKSRKAN